MSNSQKGASFLAILFFIAFIIATSLGGYFIYLRMHNRYNEQPQESAFPTTAPAASKFSIQDINRDGKVDAIDKQFFSSEMGCDKDSLCWDKVIGKTSDGDNPIYTKDLDLNKDGKITQDDMNVK